MKISLTVKRRSVEQHSGLMKQTLYLSRKTNLSCWWGRDYLFCLNTPKCDPQSVWTSARLDILGPVPTHSMRWSPSSDGQAVLGYILQYEAVQMADWSTVILVPWMRFSSCPSIRGSHWLKFLSRPARIQKCRIKNVQNGTDLVCFSPISTARLYWTLLTFMVLFFF